MMTTKCAAQTEESTALAGPLRFAPEECGWKVSAKNLAMQAAGRCGAYLRLVGGNRACGKLGILTYHRVSPRVPGLPAPYYNVTPDRFREQILGLKRRGYTFLGLNEALRISREGQFAPRSVVVTFDDGFANVYSNAFPVLHEAQVPATIFLNTAYLDSDRPFPFDAWARQYASQSPPETWRPLTREECREMQQSGLITLGAHTHTHQDFRGRAIEFERDTNLSVKLVREWFGEEEVTFAFPYGSVHQGFAGGELQAATQNISLSCALTTDTRHVEANSDPNNWGRFNVFEWDTSATLAGKLDGWYTWAQQLFRSMKGSALAKPCRNAVGQAVDVSQLHVAFLTNMIPPHMAPMLRELQRRCRRLTVLISTAMESDRDWNPDWDGLEVVVQKSLTRTRTVKHRDGFVQEYPTHFPIDTISQLRRLNPDVVVSSEMGTRSLLASIYTRLLSRKALILSCGLSEHTERNIGWFRTQIRKRLVRLADHLCSTGTSGVRYLRKLGAAADRVSVSPYARVPQLSFEKLANVRTGSPTRLLYVGRLIELKGIVPFTEGLIEWARVNPDQRLEFWLAGDGSERPALERLSPPENLSLKLLGAMKFEHLREVYTQCDVLVLPTLTDEWGLVVDEAFAAGVPVLGSVCAQAVTDLVREQVNGWQYDPRQPEQLQQALSKVFATSAERLKEMRREAVRSVDHRTPQFSADCLVQAITSAVKHQRGT